MIYKASEDGRVIIPAPIPLRDYFAGQALAGLLSTQDEEHPFYEMPAKYMANLAYRYADAMLEARK